MKTLLLLFTFWASASAAGAANLITPAGHNLHWELPSGWQVAATPPQELIDDLADAIGRQAQEKGQRPPRPQLEKAAMQRLAANELLLVHAPSGAWVSFDFSPLRSGKKQPSARELKLSSRYALEALKNEEGVTLLDSADMPFDLNGANGTRQVMATYRKGRSLLQFHGLIGALAGERFYVYVTSYPQKSALDQQIKTLLEGLSFTP